MATMQGLGSSWSLKKESTFGTLNAPDRAIPFLSESLKLDYETIDSKTLKGGNYLPPSASWRRGASSGGGDVQTLLFASGATLLWEAMLGTSATTGSGPYTHTASAAATLPSYSMDITIGGTTSGFMRKTVLGAKVDSWQLKAAVGANVTLGTTWVYKSETLAAGAIRGTYGSSMRPYQYTEGVISGGGTPAGCVQDITINGNNNLLKDQKCLGSATITEPVRNGFGAISGSMDVLFDGTTTNYALYTAGTEVSLILTFTSGVTAGATETLTMNVRIDGSTPTVGGDGLVSMAMPFTCIASTTDASALTVVTVNSDATA